MQKSLKAILTKTKEDLRKYSSSPEIDAEVLIRFIKNVSRLDVITKADEILFDASELEQLGALIERRRLSEPVAYIIKRKEFFGRDFYVDPSVLIPRPETEILVEEVLKRNTSSNVSVLDLGTGSGCLAISLSCEFEKQGVSFSGCAVDISEEALNVAIQNAEAHGVSNIEFKKSSWFECVEGTFDFILSNPPYISESDERVHPDTHLYEPHGALYAGQNGDEAIREILEGVSKHLSRDGVFLVEFGAGQGDVIKKMCGKIFSEVDLIQDLQGRERVCVCTSLKDPSA